MTIPMFFADPNWYNTPIDYEIIDEKCNYCGGDARYFDPELAGCLPDENGEYPDGFWVCPCCESYNEALEQGTLYT
ncbi:MAG: hypothetical protein QNJ37_18090 [Crocosphaera sp.]|nr:hypothetical protein [Crocosphaera sp.]